MPLDWKGIKQVRPPKRNEMNSGPLIMKCPTDPEGLRGNMVGECMNKDNHISSANSGQVFCHK